MIWCFARNASNQIYLIESDLEVDAQKLLRTKFLVEYRQFEFNVTRWESIERFCSACAIEPDQLLNFHTKYDIHVIFKDGAPRRNQMVESESAWYYFNHLEKNNIYIVQSSSYEEAKKALRAKYEVEYDAAHFSSGGGHKTYEDVPKALKIEKRGDKYIMPGDNGTTREISLHQLKKTKRRCELCQNHEI